MGGVTSLSDFHSPKLERSLDVGGCGDDPVGGGRRGRKPFLSMGGCFKFCVCIFLSFGIHAGIESVGLLVFYGKGLSRTTEVMAVG